MPDENLLATLEQGLRQTRATRARLAGRLAELEAETEKIRTELSEMDALASQTEAAMFRIMSSFLGNTSSQITANSVPSDAMIEAALRQDAAATRTVNTNSPMPVNFGAVSQSSPPLSRPHVTSSKPDVEAKSDRFLDRTIPQATALILREEGEPLHVNEIYNRLLEGGFVFSGQHPTISIAVSLNRNRRFRKVAPGTFDLAIREAVQAS
jgi:hypothetical protein